MISCIVCLTIAAADDDRAAAEQRHAILRGHFGSVVGLVHGRMPAAERDRAMRDFVRGKIRLLVATTVIEVGVDVPTAGVIVIEHAERFDSLSCISCAAGSAAHPSVELSAPL